MQQTTTIAIDLAKSVFQVAVSTAPGTVGSERRLSRSRFLEFFASQPPARIVMEACGSAHHWARQLQTLGHQVLLLPAQHVRHYRLGNKTDRADCRALLEAHRCAALRPVPIKSLELQAIATLHRVRCGWLTTRTARLNALRGALRECGIAVPIGASRVLPALHQALASNSVPLSLHHALLTLCDEVHVLDQHITTIDRQLDALAQQLPLLARLRTIPGIGPLTSTALLLTWVDAHRFPSARHAASFLGLTPKEHSSGNRRQLGAISKRGDRYLRTLLIHGARAVLLQAKRLKRPDRLRLWALRIEQNRGHNRAAVALANRLARIAWAVWIKQQSFHSQIAG